MPVQDDKQTCASCGYSNSVVSAEDDWIKWQASGVFMFLNTRYELMFLIVVPNVQCSSERVIVHVAVTSIIK